MLFRASHAKRALPRDLARDPRWAARGQPGLGWLARALGGKLRAIALGHLIAGLVLQSGAFSQRDSYWVWATLAGSSVGLLASSQGRLLASAYYAIGDTRRPLGFARRQNMC